MATTIAPSDLDGIEFLWEDGLRAAYDAYLASTSAESLALAAALVETALLEQRLGTGAAAAPALLVADLCLARASRLLAHAAPAATQVAFARVVEDAAAAAATEKPLPDVRRRLIAILEEGR